MAGQNHQGTGRHGHKDTQEPYPHHEGQQGNQTRSAQGGREHGGGQHDRGSENQSLKEREYRDSQGNVHHHTKTYQEQHGKD